jgi:hypothetical protein
MRLRLSAPQRPAGHRRLRQRAGQSRQRRSQYSRNPPRAPLPSRHATAPARAARSSCVFHALLPTLHLEALDALGAHCCEKQVHSG